MLLQFTRRSTYTVCVSYFNNSNMSPTGNKERFVKTFSVVFRVRRSWLLLFVRRKVSFNIIPFSKALGNRKKLTDSNEFSGK